MEKLQDRIAVLDRAVDNVNKIKEDYIPRIDVILELAKVLPNDAWVKSLTIVENSFEVEGDAVSSTNLIPILENSPLFQEWGWLLLLQNTKRQEKFRIKGNIQRQ